MRKRRTLAGLGLAVIVIGAGVLAYFTILVEPHRRMVAMPARGAPVEEASMAQDKNDAPRLTAESRGKVPDYAMMGFELMDRESLGFLQRGLSAVKVRASLGEPEEKTSASVWEADGLTHQDWYYRPKGIELNLIGEEQHQTIHMINIKSPCACRTKRDIGIGSTREAVQKAYQNEINPEDSGPGSLVAGSIYGGLIFRFNEDRVSSIFIGAVAE